MDADGLVVVVVVLAGQGVPLAAEGIFDFQVKLMGVLELVADYSLVVMLLSVEAAVVGAVIVLPQVEEVVLVLVVVAVAAVVAVALATVVATVSIVSVAFAKGQDCGPHYETCPSTYCYYPKGYPIN